MSSISAMSASTSRPAMGASGSGQRRAGPGPSPSLPDQPCRGVACAVHKAFGGNARSEVVTRVLGTRDGIFW